MNLLTFDEAVHKPNGYINQYVEYEVDFDTAEHRKCKKDQHVTFYENGTLVIRGAPYGGWYDPDIRDRLKKEYGIRFELKKDITGLEFFSPDDRPVAKSHIGANILLVDDNHRMVLSNDRWGDEIRYYGPHARPLGGRPIKVSSPNPAARKEYEAALADVFALARTYYALASANGPRLIGGWEAKQYILGKTARMLTPQQDEQLLYEVGWYVTKRAAVLQDWLVEATKRHYKVPYLYFKEKA